MMGQPSGPRRSGGRFGSSPAQLGLIAVVLILVIYAVQRSHRVSSYEILYFVLLVPSIILHEVSHGWVALACGDDTAKRAGRLTLNPLPHIDPIGTVILPAILVVSGAGAFGYAKPVPVNVRGLRHPRNQTVLVSLAGPAVNIVLALLADLALHLAPSGTLPPTSYVAAGYIPTSLFWQGVFVFGLGNMVLAIFNLIPLPPLDGSAVVERLLPRSWWPGYLRVRMYALPVLIGLVLLARYDSSLSAHFSSAVLRLWGDIIG